MDYRAQFSRPLIATNGRLSRLCYHLGLDAEITQRLKKSPTILDKLRREDGLDLSRMQDIGGCRAVVATAEELYLLSEEAQALWAQDVHHVKDYVAEPRPSGYRAIHVVVMESGLPIEIQLRTTQMHEWAETVEAFSNRLGENLKQDGTHVVQEFMATIADIPYVGNDPSALLQLTDKLDKLRPMVETLLQNLKEAQGGQQ
ncbi:RelA/SpoT domain-containing protein [Arthrobacter woluwensis]|uniref:RelA/SpoT domain-containing protein n=1 Tax=Arthrobacter woluwensis TaxID=156980 RepID=UPI001643A3FD|nr:RelA/SpoT domain-containing protein [Arthrobacter woluwensis]